MVPGLLEYLVTGRVYFLLTKQELDQDRVAEKFSTLADKYKNQAKSQ